MTWKTTVDVTEPSLGIVVALVLTHLSVEPTIWIGICAVAPAVAVIVAVRLA